MAADVYLDTNALVEIVSREDLEARRRRLLRRAGMSKRELDRGAHEYTLTDEQRDIYDTLQGVDWLLIKE